MMVRIPSSDKEDEKTLQDMEEIEDQRTPGLSNTAMGYLNQIKELQEQRDQLILSIETLDMSILGYSHALEEEMSKKGH